MNKMKARKGLLKRVKVTGTNKVMRRKGGSGHLLSNKSGRRLQRLKKQARLSHAHEKKVYEMIKAAL